MDRVVTAWEIWGAAATRLRLTAELQPVRDDCPSDADRHRWDEYLEDSKQVLFTSVALDEPGLQLATFGFAHSLRAELERLRELNFIRNLWIRKSGSVYQVQAHSR